LILTTAFKLELTSDFIEIFDDQNTGPDLNTVRLTNLLIPNDGLGKRVIKMDSKKPTRIWYHANKAETDAHKENMLNFHYKWIMGN
jgi:hypothetical protein